MRKSGDFDYLLARHSQEIFIPGKSLSLPRMRENAAALSAHYFVSF
jgi:hypothetical protein